MRLLEVAMIGAAIYAITRWTSSSSSPGGSTADAIVAKAKADLSIITGVAVPNITTRSVEKKDWPDTSLACPQGGMTYLQVITPGYRLLLEALGKTYEYHTDLAGRVALCE
ncbi:MAG: hypothetical protein M1343_06980 [Chloroflexi bacterium]|nr:hypothetical protein [Chloroflexota bacterium]MDA8186835.1 hypothetical protein [Dehalococcoidales bacterium]